MVKVYDRDICMKKDAYLLTNLRRLLHDSPNNPSLYVTFATSQKKTGKMAAKPRDHDKEKYVEKVFHVIGHIL